MCAIAPPESSPPPIPPPNVAPRSGYALERARRRSWSRQRDSRTDGRRPQAFVVVTSLVVDCNRDRVARLGSEVGARLQRHFEFDIAAEHRNLVATGRGIERHRLRRRILDCPRRHADRTADLDLGRNVIFAERLIRIDMPSLDHLGVDLERAGAARLERRIDSGGVDFDEFIRLDRMRRRRRKQRHGKENSGEYSAV